MHVTLSDSPNTLEQQQITKYRATFVLLTVLGLLSLLQQNIDLLHQLMEADLIKGLCQLLIFCQALLTTGLACSLLWFHSSSQICVNAHGFLTFDSRFRPYACPLSTVEVAHHYLKWDAQFSILLSFSCSRGSLSNMTRTHMTQSVSVKKIYIGR